MTTAPRDTTTRLLVAFDNGDPVPLEVLIPLMYDELHRIARGHLAREQPGHTLRPTGLVHEAYLRLVDDTRVSARGRAYFFGAAGRAMRQVLVDHARQRKAAKRGGDRVAVTLEEGHASVDALAHDVLDLDAALERLAAESERSVRVVECRFFGGLSVEETAAALGVSERTVKYDWKFARAWLYRELS